MIDRCCISLTEKCNLRCKYCHFTLKGRRSRDVTYDEVGGILRSIQEYVLSNSLSSFKIGIVGGGEPTLRFGLLEHVVEVLEKYPAIHMYTISNGFNLSDEQLNFFFEHKTNLDLCLSIDGNQAMHDINRIDVNGNGTFQQVMRGACRYEKLFGEKPAVNCTITPEHLDRSEEIIRFFVDNGFRRVTFSKLFDSGSVICEKKFDEFLHNACEKLILRQMNDVMIYDCCQYGRLCGVGRTNIYYASGKVYPCGRFAGREEFCLGDATDSLDLIESRLNTIKPCADGLCYYDEMIKNKKVKQ